MKITIEVLKILHCLKSKPCYGLEIIKATRISSATGYPLFNKMLAAGLINGYPEKGRPNRLGRPVRFYWHLTKEGIELYKKRMEWFGVDL